jgi:hypothetical protein
VTPFERGLRIESISFNCDSASIITGVNFGNLNGSGFVTAIGNISASRAGGCVLTVAAGMFSAVPHCQVTNHKAADDNGFLMSITVTSTTSIIVDCDQHEGTDCTSFDGYLTCFGPR